MTDVAVSICVPAYRSPETLERTIASICEQTFSDYEIVVTDDSPDDSVRSLIDRKARSAPVRYYHNVERLGSPDNWNRCVSLASGELIKILHHDDWFTSRDSLRQYVDLMNVKTRSYLGFSATAVSNPDGTLQRVNRPPLWWVSAVRRNPRWLFPWNMIGSPSATIYRRSSAVPFDRNLKWVVDVDFYVRSMMRNPDLAFAPQTLVATTNGLPTQVTAQSLGNRRVELFEWIYLYDRLFNHTGATPHPLQLKFMWDLLGKYDVSSLHDLHAILGSVPVPEVVARMVQLRHVLRRLRETTRQTY